MAPTNVRPKGTSLDGVGATNQWKSMDQQKKNDWKNCMVSHTARGRALSPLCLRRNWNPRWPVYIFQQYLSSRRRLCQQFADEIWHTIHPLSVDEACFLVNARVYGWSHSIILHVDATTQIKPCLIGEENVIENSMTILKDVTKLASEVLSFTNIN